MPILTVELFADADLELCSKIDIENMKILGDEIKNRMVIAADITDKLQVNAWEVELQQNMLIFSNKNIKDEDLIEHFKNIGINVNDLMVLWDYPDDYEEFPPIRVNFSLSTGGYFKEESLEFDTSNMDAEDRNEYLREELEKWGRNNITLAYEYEDDNI